MVHAIHSFHSLHGLLSLSVTLRFILPGQKSCLSDLVSPEWK